MIFQASNVLLDLAGSTIEKSSTGRHPNYRVDNVDDGRVFVDPNDSVSGRNELCLILFSNLRLFYFWTGLVFSKTQ